MAETLRQRIEAQVRRCRDVHFGFQTGRHVGFCPECGIAVDELFNRPEGKNEASTAALAIPDGPEPLNADEWDFLADQARNAAWGAAIGLNSDAKKVKAFNDLAVKARAHAKAQKPVATCERTGKPCGTDTYPRGSACPCGTCHAEAQR